jgi:AAA15 family ATPase/GTPase
MTVRLLAEPIGERFVVTRRNGELTAKKLITYHSKSDGTETEFETRQESDGSQRVIDLLPAFLDLLAEGSKKVYVIDEIDRSLHTLLTRRLLEMYLSNCSATSRTQLLLTTHDVLLMDQQLLRRDEMWVSERDSSGASSLFSFSEYKDIRYDKDIRKSYLQGRLGGIPRLLLGSTTANPCLAEVRRAIVAHADEGGD